MLAEDHQVLETGIQAFEAATVLAEDVVGSLVIGRDQEYGMNREPATCVGQQVLLPARQLISVVTVRVAFSHIFPQAKPALSDGRYFGAWPPVVPPILKWQVEFVKGPHPSAGVGI